MHKLGVAIRTWCFGLLLIMMMGAAAFATQANVTCTNTTATRSS
jgi:hypothetical protein